MYKRSTKTAEIAKLLQGRQQSKWACHPIERYLYTRVSLVERASRRQRQLVRRVSDVMEHASPHGGIELVIVPITTLRVPVIDGEDEPPDTQEALASPSLHASAQIGPG